MLLLKNFRSLKASSLLESVIAIAIISICILVAFSIYLNVMNTKKPIAYLNAKHKVEAWTQEIISKRDFDDDTYSTEGFVITKSAQINEHDKNVLLKFSITTHSKTYEIQKMVLYTNADDY